MLILMEDSEIRCSEFSIRIIISLKGYWVVKIFLYIVENFINFK